MTDIWELHDIGRTICAPGAGLYEAIVQYAHKFFPSQRADELVASAKLRETRGTTPQNDFNDFCKIWCRTIEGGDFVLTPKKGHEDLVVPGTMVYKDAVEYLVQMKKHGMRLGILTSDSEEFDRHLLHVTLPEPVIVEGIAVHDLADLVDKSFRGEEYGSKDKPESIDRVYEAATGNSTNGIVNIIFDDKISVCEAAMKSEYGIARVVLMDRAGDYKSILDIDNPFTCYEASLKHRGAWDNLSDKEKRVVKLHNSNQFGVELPLFEVVGSYTEFTERQIRHSESHERYQKL